VLEGFHVVKHALRFGARLSVLVGTDASEIEHLSEVLAPDLVERFARELRIIAPDEFSRLASYAPRTGVMAIAERPRADLRRVMAVRDRPVVLLENPRSLGNLGACVRVAAASDVAGVLTTGSEDPWHADALRGAAGLHFALPVIRVAEVSFPDHPLIAVDPGGQMFRPDRMPPRAVLAFGAERYGLSDELLARCDQCVSIPMRAGVSSLNLATAVAAILFAWRLQPRAADTAGQEQVSP
jgi:TrmH family RNA methyltransferase